MFDAITCLRVCFGPLGVVTVFSFRPEGVPSYFESWGKFETRRSDVSIVAEVCTDSEYVTRSTRSRWTSPHVRARHRVDYSDRIL